MRRRTFLTLLGGMASWPLARARAAGRKGRARGRAPSSNLDNPVNGARLFRHCAPELRRLGFTEGHQSRRRTIGALTRGLPQSLRRRQRAGRGRKPTRSLPAVQKSHCRRRPRRGRPVPIPMLANNYDPFARGYVKSLSRPGGNITGLFYRQPELVAKQVELLVEVFPDLKTARRALGSKLGRPVQRGRARVAVDAADAATAVKLESPPYDFDAAFPSAGAAWGANGARAVESVLHRYTAHAHRRSSRCSIACRRCSYSSITSRQRTMSYGVDAATYVAARLASYVAKILRGAQPADLPVEQPSNFELMLNFKTAEALGLNLPTSILLRADEVIE